ncbi:MAG: hypothetical protein A3E84_00935 [Gammaproteobacteria bacterium RIFCSPHIGHO2_12_FULL_42_13]|nr:MAG: hypothetical protein A3E84_00935 [Gammaproteobacteria bacterium RIFCSPHIGHO2_12_FULL_42_13]
MAESHQLDGDKILDIYLQLSVLLTSIGATAYEVTGCLSKLSHMIAFPLVHLSPLPNTISLSLKYENKFYTAIARFEQQPTNASLLTRIEKELFTVQKANQPLSTVFQQIMQLSQQPLRPWLCTLAACIIQCFATCRFFGGDWAASFGAGGAAFVSFATFRYFEKNKLNVLLLDSVVAFLSGVVAILIGGALLSQTPLAMLFASIIWLVPGMAMMNSFSDLFHGYISSALHNFAKAWMIIFSLLLGLIPALMQVTNLTVALAISPWQDWFWAGLALLACAYRFEAIGKLLLSSFLLGAIGHGLRAVWILQLGYDPVTATFIAALGVGIAIKLYFGITP